MKHTLSTLSLTAVLVFSSSTLLAKDYKYRDYDRHDNYERHYDNHGEHNTKARVVNVEPIYKTVRIASPYRDCQRNSYRRTGESYTSTIAGGIIGGVIGNQFGKGSGKTAMTVAGTLLGGSIGRDHTNGNYAQPHRHNDSCRVSERYTTRQEIDGYYVTYKYDGKRYTTEMDRHPGKFIPVTVSVRPNYRYNY